MRHLSWRAIVEAAESAGSESTAAARHLDACAPCARRVREARGLLDSLELAGAREPSEFLVSYTWERLRREMETPRAAGSLGGALAKKIRLVWAALVADSWRPAPALRGTAGAAARALIFETPEYGISLFVSSELDGHGPALLGQIVPKLAGALPPSSRAALVTADGAVDVQVSELGEFRFPEVPPGNLALAVELGDLRIQCPPFSVSPEGPGKRSSNTGRSA